MARRNWKYIANDLYWLKQDIIRRFRLDTPDGFWGTITLITGLALLGTLTVGLAKIFRAFIPWVHGTYVDSVYWQSIRFGLAAGFLLIVFILVSILFVFNRRQTHK
ncbi:MAG: hypothetical protein LBT32_04100 [Peptococcaceae bacterium]|jgi:hypothetical protein|nr:hypothetical protein [Peptococcaceae bacterium]